MVEFKNFYVRFEQLEKKFKKRDKAILKFKHYYEKLEKLRKENGGNNYGTSTKEAEKLARVSS